MKGLLIILLTCLTLVSCSKIDKEKTALTDLPLKEQENTNTIFISTMDNKIALPPKMEITRENIFAGFPENPDYFIENDINVTIERVDERLSRYPKYYGLEPVFVTGENFKIIYATDEGYEIRCINLMGKGIFSYWDPFFDAKWDDVKESWGEPEAGRMSYFDSTGWYYVGFTEDKKTGKIIEIEIARSL